jgi:hypothetical protein
MRPYCCGGMLCSRCGSTEREWISETEGRCAECGLGWTSQRLVIGLATDESRAWAARVRELENQFAGPPPAFAEATLPLFGLNPTWSGLRWFGGSGSSNGVVTELTLAHGDAPWDLQQPQVRVETRSPGDSFGTDQSVRLAMAAFLLARSQVQRFWSATHTLPDPVRAAAFPIDGVQRDPTEPWTRRLIPIDAAPIEFRILEHEAYWVGQAVHDGVLLGIDARAWPIATTALVSVRDLTPYVEGAREIRNRRPI